MKKWCFNLPQCMFQLAPHTGLVETVRLPPKKSIYFENLLLIQYLYDWFMCPKYMWLDMPDAFCCSLSLFRVFAKIKKTVSTSPGLSYPLIIQRRLQWFGHVHRMEDGRIQKDAFYCDLTWGKRTTGLSHYAIKESA